MGAAYLGTEDLVFTWDDGRAVIPDFVTIKFGTVTGKLEGLPRLVLHGLRHTHATILLWQPAPTNVATGLWGEYVVAESLRGRGWTPYHVRYDTEEDALMLPRPGIVALTATGAAEWGQSVDESRRQYATGFYKRGQKKGEPLTEDGLMYPVNVDHGLELGTFLAQLLPRTTTLSHDEAVEG